MQQKGLDNSQIGVAAAILPMFVILGSFFVPRVINTNNPRKIFSFAIFGYFIFLIFFFLSSNFLEFMASYVILGIAAAFFWISGRNFIFHLKGIVKSSSYFYTAFLSTGVIAPYIGGALITYLGYYATFFLGSLIILSAIPIALIFYPTKIRIKAKRIKFKIDRKLFSFLPLVLTAGLIGTLFFLFPVFLKENGINELQIGIIATVASVTDAVLQIPSGKLISRITINKSLVLGFLILGLAFLMLEFLPKTFWQVIVDVLVWSIGGSVVGIAVFAATGKIAQVKAIGAQMFEVFNNGGSLIGYFLSGFVSQIFGFNFLFIIAAVLGFSAAVYSDIYKKVTQHT